MKDLGHFETVYKNTEGLLLHFGAQLDKLFRMDAPQTVVEKARQKPDKTIVIELINKGDFFQAFEECNKFFLGDNDALNALRDEYIDQANNFKPGEFASRLKTFVSNYYDPLFPPTPKPQIILSKILPTGHPRIAATDQTVQAIETAIATHSS